LEVTPDVDAFSKLATRRFPRFWGPDSPENEDAFRRSWSDDVIWANPPFSRLKDVVWKWQEDQAHGTIIAPKWPTAIWFEDLMSMVIRGLVFPGGSEFFWLDACPAGALKWDVLAVYVCGRPEHCRLTKIAAEEVQVASFELKMSKSAKRKARKRTLEGCLERCLDGIYS
jgi:hypothetical protein